MSYANPTTVEASRVLQWRFKPSGDGTLRPFMVHPDFETLAGDAIWTQAFFIIIDAERLSQENQLEKRFNALVEKWTAAVENMSSLTQMVSERSYLQIIAMGEAAVPFLFRELELRPDYWFTALQAILNVAPDPALPGHRGNLEEMANDWIEWGKREGYID